jgi:hypothetical protein
VLHLFAAPAAADPLLDYWLQNTTGQTGHSPNATINSTVSLISANIQQVRYTPADVFINATDIPSYDIGPWPSNPNVASDQHLLERITRTPTLKTSANTATGLGTIGVWLNGVDIFNAKDANSYNNQNVWHSNAVVVEASGFDAALGHPEQQGGYHHHQHPVALAAQLGESSSHVSPLLGFAFDGFPVYGAYMYANADGTGGVKRMVSSYQLRSGLTTRNTVVHLNTDGTTTTMNVTAGPSASAQFPLGYYVEDFQYVANSGDLNQFNMRFTVTPEYPLGTWAYFTTVDAAGNSAYPYVVGEYYGGNVMQDDITHTVSVPTNALVYTVPEPGTWSLLALGSVIIFASKRRPMETPSTAI